MTDQPVATEVVLSADDPGELADLMVCLREWLTGSDDSESLAASLDRFPDSVGTDRLPEVQLTLTRFASLLAPSAAEVDF